MRLTIVVADSIRDAINTRCEARNHGAPFTVAFAHPSAPSVPVAWVSSWDTVGHIDATLDANGEFDLRDEMEGHAWLNGKLRNIGADGTCTVTRGGNFLAKVYVGDWTQWHDVAVMNDLGLIRLVP